MADDDAELVALIDDELDEASKSRLLARLAQDEALRARYEALREARPQIAAAFSALLDRAPLARLTAALATQSAPPPTRPSLRGFAWREFAAGLLIGLVAAGAAAWVALGLANRDRDDWRAAVVDYMKLYTNETFAFSAPDRQIQAGELGLVGQKVGADLTPDSVAEPGLTFKVAFILSYDGSPLGEVAYVDPTGAPVLFCVIANGAADAPARAEERDGLSLVSWSRGGRSFLVIGGLPERQIAQFARALEKRV